VSMLRRLSDIPKFFVTALNHPGDRQSVDRRDPAPTFVGCVSRTGSTIDPVPFTWVEEVAEMSHRLADLDRSPAIGIHDDALRISPLARGSCIACRRPTPALGSPPLSNHALIVGASDASRLPTTGVQARLLKRTRTPHRRTPSGSEDHLAWLYASRGGRRRPDRRLWSFAMNGSLRLAARRPVCNLNRENPAHA